MVYYSMYVLLLIHPLNYLINYLPTYYPPTHLLIITDWPIRIYFLTYLPTYLPTYLHIIYLPIHPLTYLILTNKCNHEV
jgi:hypothetical protein